MEQGGSSKQQHNHTIRASIPGVVIREPTENNNTEADVNDLNNLPQHQSFNRGNDQYMPLANVNRIMRRILPPQAKIADDAKETMQECVSEFIHFVTSEANRRCHGDYRKTISAEDIISAMGTLGFNNYVEPLTLLLNKSRSQEQNRNRMHQASFGRHNARLFHQPVAQLVPPPPPSLPTDHASFAVPDEPNVGGNDDSGMPDVGDSYMGNQGGVDGSSGIDFDPFRHFK